MSLEDWIELNDIHIKLINHQITLQEVKDLYLQAKEIFINNKSRFSRTDIDLLLQIFIKGSEKIGEFWQKWQKKNITPTDEELSLLEDAFNEASWVFNQLATSFPNLFSSQANQVKQERIKKNIKIVAGEKERRKNSSNSSKPENKNKNQWHLIEDKDNHSFLKPFCFGIVFCLVFILIVMLFKKLGKLRKRKK